MIIKQSKTHDLFTYGIVYANVKNDKIIVATLAIKDASETTYPAVLTYGYGRSTNAFDL